MKFLFVNGCIRGSESRTLELCRDYIEKFKRAETSRKWQFEEVELDSAGISMTTCRLLEEREQLLAVGDFEAPMFRWARQFIEADHILIGAPYWDLSFPAAVKAYLERCSVTGLTFIYDEKGVPHGKCKAKNLTYLTTSGSPIGQNNFGYDYIKGLCGLFGIEKTFFASAESLDIIGMDVQKIMAEAKDKISEIIGKL